MAQLRMSEDVAQQIIETAVEAGHTYGIGYWARVDDYRPECAEMAVIEYDESDDTDVSRTKLNHKKLEAVLKLLVSKDLKIPERDRGAMLAMVATDNESCNLDGPMADAFVQLACFGELRYS